ncbi:unnamed protein product [Linum trigynum]|uniref:Plant bHLH transcription factor ACT-like domain-containing protein n=1 Tax=Linum trigynum TaxID=586398 RepID=A0AAV2GDJ9_9ROSI
MMMMMRCREETTPATPTRTVWGLGSSWNDQGGRWCNPSLVKVVGNQDWETSNCNERGQQQQMEVHGEVVQINGNDFFVKVFCEHSPGGFVRLIEALDSLGLEAVTNANITSCNSLVSIVFRAQVKA